MISRRVVHISLYAALLGVPVVFRNYRHHVVFASELKQVALLAACAGVALGALGLARGRPLGRWVAGWSLLAVGAWGLSTALAVNRWDAGFAALVAAAPVWLALWLAAHPLEEAALHRIGTALLLLGAAVATYTLLQQIGFDPLGWKMVETSSPSGPFSNRNMLATFLVFLLPGAGFRVLEASGWDGRVRWGLLLLALTAAVIASQTRGAWLAVLVSLPVAFWPRRSPPGEGTASRSAGGRRGWALAGLLLVGGVLAWGLLAAPDPGGERLSSRGGWPRTVWKSQAVTERRLSAQTAWDGFRDRPLIGHGEGTFPAIRMRFLGPRLERPEFAGVEYLSDHVHNDLLESLFETGLLGTLPLLALLVLAVRGGWRWRRESATSLPAWFLAGLVSILVHGLVHFPLQLPTPALYAWFAVGVLLSRRTGASPGKASPARPGSTGSGVDRVRWVVAALLILATGWGARRLGAREAVEAAQRAIERGNLPAAVTHLDTATRRDPVLAAAWINLGAARFQMRDLVGSGQAFQRALALAPDDHDAWLNYGAVVATQGNYPVAEGAFRHARTLNPRFPDAYLSLARVYLKTGRPDRAREILLQGQEYAPDHPGFPMMLEEVP